MSRALALACLVLVLSLTACGGGSSSGGSASTVSAATSATQPTPLTSSTSAAIPSAIVAAPPALGALYTDPSYVPSGPPAATWYSRLDDPSTPENEALLELAVEMEGNGVSRQDLIDHWARGGALAIFVSGAGHERDTPTKRSGWLAPYAAYVQGELDVPGIQVDYEDAYAGNDARALALYPFSLRTGITRTHGLVEKARSAGIAEVRIYGHSKGGDVVQEVLWSHAGDPLVVQGVVFGIPLWSAANPGPDGRYGYGGLFRYGVHGTRNYQGKLVVFVRTSDRASRGEMLPADTFPGPGHEYKHVFSTPGFLQRLDAIRFQEPVGFADREAGLTYDY